MKDKNLDLNDLVTFLLKTNEDIQKRIDINESDWEGLSNLKLQKLIYFIEASFLVKFNIKLFSDNYEAWQHGPVIPNLYHKLRKFKREPIFYDEFKKTGNSENIINSLTKSELNFLEDSFIKFNKFSSFELVSLSHVYGPWKEVHKNEIITKENMINFFQSINA